MKKDTIVVSGGCGFIGSNFVVDCIINRNIKIINIDKLTYAADINNIKEVKNSKDYIFINGDINDCNLVYETLERYKPKFFINFAAESHVDNSIKSPDTFMSTNILGTYSILRACQKFIDNNSEDK